MNGSNLLHFIPIFLDDLKETFIDRVDSIYCIYRTEVMYGIVSKALKTWIRGVGL